MSLRDFLEIYGGAVNQAGLPSRPYSSGAQTAAASLIGGIGTGLTMRRALDEAKRLRAAKAAFTEKVGLDYDLFAKLSAQAQESILKNSGLVNDPTQEPLSAFGGRTLQQLETQGAPARTAPALGTGIFEGAPLGGEQQLGPELPPLGAYGKAGAQRAAAIDRYLGVEPTPTPAEQSLIDYRTARLGQFERGVQGQTLLRTSEINRNRAATRAMEALTANRLKPDKPIADWEVQIGRQMGMMIPKGVRPTRAQFNGLMKYNRPAMYVVGRIDQLALAARQAEMAAQRNFSDKELAAYIAQQTPEAAALAGTNAGQIILDGVRAQLKAMRSAPDVFFTPAAGGEGDTTAIPSDFGDGDGVDTGDEGAADTGPDVYGEEEAPVR